MGKVDGRLHLGQQFYKLHVLPPPQDPTRKLQALTELRKGMLKALPRKPKATGKKPLGAEGWREGQ